jgi:benzoyl-CoA reductase/2-hydroxyglutaryl-CoA dehydratase subunit BcrC/BadD/HgdB
MSVANAELKLVDLHRKSTRRGLLKTRDELQSQLAYILDSKQEHGYSPAVGRLYDLALSYVEYAEGAARSGKRASWVMGLWDAPLMYALDIIPISLTELGRLGSSDAMTVAEDYFQLPKETCSMVAAVLGEWYLRRETTVRDVVVFNGTCEPLNMAYELIPAEGYRVHRIETANRPIDSDPVRLQQQIHFLADELADLALRLTGKPVDHARVAREIERANRILGKVRRIMDLRRQNPLYIKSLPTMFLLMGSGHYFGRPEEYEAALDQLLAELEVAPIVPSPRGKIVPLAWIGGRGQEFGVYKAVDDCGGAILAWYTPNSWTHDWPEAGTPLESIATHVLGGTAGHIVGSPVHRLKPLEALIERYGAKGILFYGYVGCSFAGVHQEIQREHFHRRGVPSIALEGSFQVGPPTGQLLTRVRAFVEMLS